jgi:hypothetical protein
MLNETYQIFLQVNCFNGSFSYYYGAPREELPDGESALEFMQVFPNGTVYYLYANGTNSTYDPSWGYGVLKKWADSDCNYTQYNEGTSADCSNKSYIYFPTYNYSSTNDTIIRYEYSTNGTFETWQNGTVFFYPFN